MQFDQLKRREFIALLGGAAAALPARAQQGERVRRIAVLMNLINVLNARPRRARPRRRAAQQRDELAPFHSITSSARVVSRFCNSARLASSIGG